VGPYAHRPRSADTRSIGGALLGAGAISGVAAGMVIALWQMVVGAIAQEPTAAPGIDSSFWTTVSSDPKMIEPYAAPLDADVEWVGDGPVPPEPVGNGAPAPGIP
jgi:hypothetical protein